MSRWCLPPYPATPARRAHRPAPSRRRRRPPGHADHRALRRASGCPQLIRQLPPRTGAIAVDLGVLADPGDPLTSPPLDLAEELAELGVAMLPVLRAYDSRRRLVEHGLAARMHLKRAVLRLQPHVDARNPLAATETTERMLTGSGLEAEQVDLVIDLAETACTAHADRFEERARHVLRWAQDLPWRSVTVAAGAMPANLDDLPDRRAGPGRAAGRPGVGPALRAGRRLCRLRRDFTRTPSRRPPPAAAHPALHRRARLVDLPVGAARRRAATTAATTCAGPWSTPRSGPAPARASPGATRRSPGRPAAPGAAAARRAGWPGARHTTSPTCCSSSPGTDQPTRHKASASVRG